MKPLLALAAALSIAAPAFAQTAAQTAPETAAQTAPQTSASGPREEATTAQGTGEIKAVDSRAGTVTIHHAPIAALGWPAMTMAFKASPEALRAARTGETVSFTLDPADNRVVAIQPR